MIYLATRSSFTSIDGWQVLLGMALIVTAVGVVVFFDANKKRNKSGILVACIMLIIGMLWVTAILKDLLFA